MNSQSAPPMDKKKKIIIGCAIGLGLIILGWIGYTALFSGPSETPVKTLTLGKGDLQRTVSADGQVISTFTEQISNTSNIPVWSVDVSVGNYVNKGDRLCRLYNKEADEWQNVNSTASGTITAVNAVNGAPANGVLFTIQNTGDLQVNMKIKESDIDKVASGMKVNIKTDATGNRVYTGTVGRIAPTASNMAGGNAAVQGNNNTGGTTSTKAEFEAIVPIDSPADGLYIGMKTKQEVVVEERPGVFNVPFDAVAKDEKGNTQVFVVNTDEKGKMTVEAIPVSLGIQTDFAVEIAGEKLEEGMTLVSNPSGLTPGQAVVLENESNAAPKEGASQNAPA